MQVKLISGFSNTYLIFWDGEGIIVDPGNPPLDWNEDLKIKAILITHGHIDHYIYLDEYKRRFACPAYMNPKDMFLVEDPSWLTEKFAIVIDYVPKIEGKLGEGDKFSLGSKTLEIIEIPGHSPGSIGIVGERFVIVGDLMFEGGSVGRTDVPGGDERALKESIKRILEFPEDFWVYPGHGNPFKVKEAKEWIGWLLF